MDESKSKSQKKREAGALQKMGVHFITLNNEQLARLPLTDQLRRAILDARSLKSHGAIRRQAQLIGKLMRSADYEEILAVYEQIEAESSAKTVLFHDLEQWRDRLINEGKNALTEFIATYHPEDVQHLRQLVKKAMDEQIHQKNLGASKALFRYLRSLL